MQCAPRTGLRYLKKYLTTVYIDSRFFRMTQFNRTRLKHGIPPWVRDGAIYFITINAKTRHNDTLLKNDNPTKIKSAVQNYTTQNKWWPSLVILMPDHLHVLLSLNTANLSIKQIISPWKRFLNRSAGIEWQEGFFEHRIRDDDSLREKEEYLRQNPIRAGLTKTPEDWPHIWTASDFT